MKIPSSIIASLQTEKNNCETELLNYKNELSGLEHEKTAKLLELKKKHSEEIAEFNALYETVTATLNSNIRAITLDIAKFEKAISTLDIHAPAPPKPRLASLPV